MNWLSNCSAIDSLHSLSLGNTKITDAAVKKLKPLKNLKRPSLLSCREITEAGVTQVKREIPGPVVDRPIDLPGGPPRADE